MTQKAQEIVSIFLQLEPRERAEVVSRLLSLQGEPVDDDAEALWEAEIGRRVLASDAGQVQHTPWPQLRATLRSRYESR
ncbi:MAG: addiction module protein [Candidatus Eremiobacterota bacterium]